jgi:hypothetical protein
MKNVPRMKNVPAHHHQLALSCFTAATNDLLRITMGNVVVRRDDADVIRGVPHMKALGNLLLVEKDVVAAADRRDLSGRKPIALSASRSVG